MGEPSGQVPGGPGEMDDIRYSQEGRRLAGYDRKSPRGRRGYPEARPQPKDGDTYREYMSPFPSPREEPPRAAFAFFRYPFI